jgi:cytochrome c oxidase subunit 4
MSDTHSFDFKKTVRRYIVVGAALWACTLLTVAVSYLHLETPQAIFVAMIIAIFKGTLVALFFMHLIDERKVIYLSLAFTVFFFAGLLLLPMLAHSDQQMLTTFIH